MVDFLFRPYNEESDLQILYMQQCEHALKEAIHIVWGVSPIKPPEAIRDVLQRHASNPKFLIAEDPDTHKAVGWICFSGYNRAVKHENLYLEFWGEEAYTEDFLRQALEKCFNNSSVRMIIFEVGGYRTKILESCHMLGFAQAGCIPDHIVYGEKPNLWPLYIMTMARDRWKRKSS